MTVELEIRREFSFFRQILAFSFYLNVTIGTQMVLSSNAIKELISLVFLFQGMPWGILPILHCLWSTIFPCVFGLLHNKIEAKSPKSPDFSEKFSFDWKTKETEILMIFLLTLRGRQSILRGEWSSELRWYTQNRRVLGSKTEAHLF